jgi:biopolymer transport protein ExbB/TolQ
MREAFGNMLDCRQSLREFARSIPALAALRDRSQGEGRVGCLVVALLMIGFVYLAFLSIPVYLDKMDFEEDLGRIASRAGAENWSNQVIEEKVLALARVREFHVAPEDINVQRNLPFQEARSLKLEVNFRRAVALPGYNHTFEFNSKASSFIGRL